MKTRPKKEKIGDVYKYRDRINLEPYFQREKVWPQKKQQDFIDTIIQNWGVPKFYFYISGSDKLGVNYQCVDGKQRLSSIFSFFENKFPLGQNSKGLKGKYYEDLPIPLRKKLDTYKIDIEEVSTEDDQEVGELFRRLQLGSPLNSGENLMSVKSELKDYMKRLQKNKFFRQKITLKNKRYAHFVVCSQLCFLEIEGINDITLSRIKTMLERYKKINESGFKLKVKLQKVKSVLDYLNKMFTKPSPHLKNRASIVSIYLLISELLEKANIGGKEKRLAQFYSNFAKGLEKEVEKGVKATDTQYIQDNAKGYKNYASLKLLTCQPSPNQPALPKGGFFVKISALS